MRYFAYICTLIIPIINHFYMKNLLLALSFLCLFTCGAFAQATSISANVQKISGKPVFVLAEPTKEYDAIFKREIVIVWTNNSINSVDEIANKLANMCARYSEKEKLEYDAIIVNGVSATAIKFKNGL